MKKTGAKAKGAMKEKLVAQYLKKRGWKILSQNQKILGVEIDILAKKGAEGRLIEVKSTAKAEHLEKIIKNRQKERLKQAAESLSADFPKGLRLLLASVDNNGQIEFFEIF